MSADFSFDLHFSLRVQCTEILYILFLNLISLDEHLQSLSHPDDFLMSLVNSSAGFSQSIRTLFRKLLPIPTSRPVFPVSSPSSFWVSSLYI